MPGQLTTITIPTADRDALKQYKLRVAADIGKDFPMGNLIPLLVEIASNHHNEIVELAKRKIL